MRLVIASAEWVSSIPRWLLYEVCDERWIMLMRSLHQELAFHEQVGDAEALVYLMTLSRRGAMSSNYVNIFEYVMQNVLQRKSPGMPRVLETKPKSLTKAEAYELKLLKTEICEQRGEWPV